MRKANWLALLTEYLAKWQDLPFEYGKHDCCMFALGAAEVMTGESYIGKVRGYSSYAEGLEMLKEHTGRKSPLDFVSRTFEKLPSLLHAQAGDIIALKTEDGVGLGIFQGEGVFAITERDGVHIADLAIAKGAYRV